MISVTLLRQYGAAFNWPFGNAMSLILLGVTSVVILMFSKLVRIEKILRF
jgi:ABC-type spermidine/putrescine transport system permease subunit I